MTECIHLPEKAVKKVRSKKNFRAQPYTAWQKIVIAGVIEFKDSIVSKETLDKALSNAEDITTKFSSKERIV